MPRVHGQTRRRIICNARALILLPLIGLAPVAAEPVSVQATHLPSFEVSRANLHQFGQLIYRGGLDLQSSDGRFGGLSGIAVLPNNKIVFVSDTGFWVDGTLIEPNGDLLGITNVSIQPMRDGQGKSVARGKSSDAEGLDVVRRDGALNLLVSFERGPRIVSVAIDNIEGPARFGAAVDHEVPSVTWALRYNRGLEAIAVAPASIEADYLIIAEQPAEGEDTIPGWIKSDGEFRSLAVAYSDRYSVTDAAFLRSGDLLILERRFNLLDGIGTRIRRIAGDDLRKDRALDGTILFEASLRQQIDNMEGLAVQTTKEGRTFVYLVSDDNHSVLQRTLLLKFELIGKS
jgi:hypothetical protein